jgi:Peptidase M30
VFSNSSEKANATSLPTTGALAAPGAPSLAVSPSLAQVSTLTESQQRHRHHGHILSENRQLALAMRNETLPPSSQAVGIKSEVAATQLPRTALLGDTRIWNENAYTKTSYATTAMRVCAAGLLGRKIVIWVQSSAYPVIVTDAQLNAYQTTFCGTNNNDGAYAKIANAIGDVWGPVPNKYSATGIADTVGQKQDINIVILNPASTVLWGGYFYSLNNRLKTTSAAYADSNESLVFFVKAGQSQNYIQSVLIHELTHMINFYQRTVLKDDVYESWLEETTAMMTQDIFDPGFTISGGCLPIVCDLKNYAQSGAGISYFNWPTDTISTNHYYMGAGFGAFLNRRFGPTLYLQLTTDCYTAPANTSGYLCMDMLIKQNGGTSIDEEFARYGASVFGRMGGTGEPTNYGFPAKSGSVVLKTSNGAGAISTNFSYNLPAINNWWSGGFIPTPTPLSSFTYSTHTYKIDTVAAGKTSYVRSGVSVPGKTSLSVIVK